mmetsp:Transcript_9337/g.25812  ORF Transcript_9337/g.25812 Transcript_9337/m.25812 type:complete len:96 (+) Transcript_9337:2324-2611(+)
MQRPQKYRPEVSRSFAVRFGLRVSSMSYSDLMLQQALALYATAGTLCSMKQKQGLALRQQISWRRSQRIHLCCVRKGKGFLLPLQSPRLKRFYPG